MFLGRRATAMIPAKNLDRAKSWYEEKLGLLPTEEMGQMGAIYDLGGTTAFLYPTEFAGTAKHTILSFPSEDLVADMVSMRKVGVLFLEYDLPGMKTVSGLATFGPVKNAWCNDSEGNILGFVQGM